MRYVELEAAFLIMVETPAERTGLLAGIAAMQPASPPSPASPPVSGPGPAVRWRSNYPTLSGKYDPRNRLIEVYVAPGTQRVEFFMDAKRVSTAVKSPWRAVFDSRQFSNGKHRLSAVARSLAGAAWVTQDVMVKN